VRKLVRGFVDDAPMVHGDGVCGTACRVHGEVVFDERWCRIAVRRLLLVRENGEGTT
jgi:hypothetical protein